MPTDSHPEYSESGFWEKLRRFAFVAGQEVVERALQLFYTLHEPKTPKWAKTVILGSLAYFIVPVDAIPDVIPGAGYTDDLGALAAAIATVHVYITDEIKSRARAKVAKWFKRKLVDDE